MNTTDLKEKNFEADIERYLITDAKNGADCYSKNGDAVTVLTWQS